MDGNRPRSYSGAFIRQKNRKFEDSNIFESKEPSIFLSTTRRVATLSGTDVAQIWWARHQFRSIFGAMA